MHTHYVLVKDGKVLGFRDNLDTTALDAAEKAALAFGAGTEIYEIVGPFPRDPHEGLPKVEAAIRGAEPVSRIGWEGEDGRELVDMPGAFLDNFGDEPTGVYPAVPPSAPSESGTYCASAAG